MSNSNTPSGSRHLTTQKHSRQENRERWAALGKCPVGSTPKRRSPSASLGEPPVSPRKPLSPRNDISFSCVITPPIPERDAPSTSAGLVHQGYTSMFDTVDRSLLMEEALASCSPAFVSSSTSSGTKPSRRSVRVVPQLTWTPPGHSPMFDSFPDLLSPQPQADSFLDLGDESMEVEFFSTHEESPAWWLESALPESPFMGLDFA